MCRAIVKMEKSYKDKEPILVCRVCLALDIKMYRMGPFIFEVFERITQTRMHPKDGKPDTVCYICFSLLNRCMLFANMSQVTDGILTEILNCNPKLTRKLVLDHTKGIIDTYYTTPIVKLTCVDDINIPNTTLVNGFDIKPVSNEPVTIKTGNEDRQVVETSGIKESNVKKKALMLENESVTKEPVTLEFVTIKNKNVKVSSVELEEVARNKKPKLNIMHNRNIVIGNNSDNNVSNKNYFIETNLIAKKNNIDVYKNKEHKDQINNQKKVVPNSTLNQAHTNKSITSDEFTNDVIKTEIHQDIIDLSSESESSDSMDDTHEVIDRNELENSVQISYNVAENRNKFSIAPLQNDSTKAVLQNDMISELRRKIVDGINAMGNEDRKRSVECIIFSEDVEITDSDEN